MIGVTACDGCQEEPLRGTPSHGPPLTTGVDGGLAPAETRIVVDAASPLAVARVAKVVRQRLAKAGIAPTAAKIGGGTVHVDLRPSEVDTARQALASGRLDIYELDERADPWTRDPELGEGLTLDEERIGDRSVHFLVSADRAKLRAALDQTRISAIGLVGPHGAGGYRSFFARKDRDIRGEYLAELKLHASDAGSAIELRMEGAATNMLRWASKKSPALLVRANDEVVAVVRPDAPITDGRLRFELAVPTTTITGMDHGALSHVVTISEPKAL